MTVALFCLNDQYVDIYINSVLLQLYLSKLSTEAAFNEIKWVEIHCTTFSNSILLSTKKKNHLYLSEK